MPTPRPPARTPEDTLEVAITRLEMTQPARRLGISITGRDVAVVRAHRPPLHFYRYLYDTVGAPWLWWERRAMDDPDLAAIVHDDRVEILVLWVDGCPAGFGELDRRTADEVHLAWFGLVPEYLGQGLGLWFLDRVVDLAWREPIARLWVRSTSLEHPRALLVYQRAGFVAVDSAGATIVDPRARGLFPEHDET
jgi:GNAT superfamily N-acetyltransferase